MQATTIKQLANLHCNYDSKHTLKHKHKEHTQAHTGHARARWSGCDGQRGLSCGCRSRCKERRRQTQRSYVIATKTVPSYTSTCKDMNTCIHAKHTYKHICIYIDAIYSPWAGFCACRIIASPSVLIWPAICVLALPISFSVALIPVSSRSTHSIYKEKRNNMCECELGWWRVREKWFS